MPLGNAKDSFVDLQNLAETSAHPHSHKNINVAVPNKEKLQQHQLSRDPWTPSKNKFDFTSSAAKFSWWELGDDIDEYESDFYGTRKQRKRNDCLVCFWAPWFSGGGNAYDSDDDENDETDPISERQDLHNSSHREGGILKRSSMAVQVTPGVDKTKRDVYNPKDYHEHEHEDNMVHFPKPIGKAVTIQPHYTMTPQERERIWWQKTDFDEFKLELKLLTNAKQLGGCECWLGDEKPHAAEGEDSKWWHKFGHSRRGLERYLSEEQKEVEESKRLALMMVLQEQRKKAKATDKEEAIAKVYKEYTAWSRNLALAAAASDADAVKTDFDDASRKTREYYLVKQAIMSGGGSVFDQHTPAFMVPVGMSKRSKQNKNREGQAPTPHPSTGKTSISKKAAGFGNPDNVGSMMSAINVATRHGAEE